MTGQPLGGGGIPLIKSAAELAALTPPGEMFVRFQDDTTLVDGTSTMKTLGIVWLLAYNGASASAYKWEIVGGSPLSSSVATDETSTSAAYADLATVGPTVTVPLAGDYLLDFSCECYCTAVSALWVSPNGVTADEAIISINAVGSTHQSRRSLSKTGVSAGALTMKYKRSSGTADFLKRVLSVRPVRVG